MASQREKMAAALRQVEEKAQLRRRLEQMMSLNEPQNADTIDVVADVGAGFVPGLGQAQAVRDFERARRENDAVGMGLSTLAGAPLIGGVAKAANVARKAEKLQDIAEGAMQTGRMSPTTASELAEAERLADAQAIAKQVGLNTRKAEGANNLLLKSLESDSPDFRHDDARAAIERMQGLLQSRTQQNNPLKSRLNAAYQYSNSVGGMTKPDAQMSSTQRKVLFGILRGDIAYDETGELRRVK
jgi:hypothetical protein